MIAVIIPTYCEADNIGNLIGLLESLNLDLLITVVDDSSPDGTGELVKKLSEIYPNITLIERKERSGIGKAILTGVKYISSLNRNVEYVAVMDADLSHDPKELPRLIDAVGDYDLAIGSRYVKGGGIEEWGFIRRIISKAANRLVDKVLHLGVQDVTSGYRVYRLASLLKICDSVRSFGFSFQLEVLHYLIKNGFKVVEEPVKYKGRRKGKTKFSFKEIFSFLWILLRLKIQDVFGQK